MYLIYLIIYLLTYLIYLIIYFYKQNMVILISGATGSGKTTQIPQIILDYFSANKKGGECHVIVTEPRRLAAIVSHLFCFDLIV